jgi:hypothetical protein
MCCDSSSWDEGDLSQHHKSPVMMIWKSTLQTKSQRHHGRHQVLYSRPVLFLFHLVHRVVILLAWMRVIGSEHHKSLMLMTVWKSIHSANQIL